MPETGRAWRRHGQLPRRVLLTGAALALVTAAVTDFGGLFGPRDRGREGVALMVRELTFADRADGGITVRDAAADQVLAELPPGSDGFLRGALRALTRQRRMGDQGRDTPFRLVAWQDGRLTLEDPTTGARIALDAFGDTNREAFARFLRPRGEA